MPRHHETNPHFGPSRHQDQPFPSPSPGVTTPRHQDGQNQLPGSRVSHPPQPPDQLNRPVGPSVTGPWPHDQQNQPLGSSVAQPQRHEQQNRPAAPLETGQRQPRRSPWFSLPWQSPSSPRATEPQRHDQHSQPPSSPAPRTKKPKRQDRRRPLGPWAMLPEHRDQPIEPSGSRTPQPKEGAWATLPERHDQPIPPSGPRAPQPKEGLGARPTLPEHHDQHIPPSGPRAPQRKERWPEQKDQHSQPHGPQVLLPPYQGQHRPPHGLRKPSPQRTKFFTWFLAGFCAIFWIVIILGGLIVLIVYLLFRPHNPQFDVSGVTLNAAYLDMDVLLNADLTVLANFTNPNRKVKVDFSYVVLDLYYGSTLIASQYIEPFSAYRGEYKLQDVHLVTSQVRLPVGEIQRLKKEISTNAVLFKIKGVFHARSNLGNLLRYSYRLYGTCVVMVNGPPTGVIRAKRCKTKH